jgi:hypothetical protein
MTNKTTPSVSVFIFALILSILTVLRLFTDSAQAENLASLYTVCQDPSQND